MSRHTGKNGNGEPSGDSGAAQLKAKLVNETARMPWSELQRFYARGQVVRVAPGLDLIDVAMAVAQDDKAQVQSWLEQGLFGDLAPSQAQAWFDKDAHLWTVVVAPWVLVQEAGPNSDNANAAVKH